MQVSSPLNRLHAFLHLWIDLLDRRDVLQALGAQVWQFRVLQCVRVQHRFQPFSPGPRISESRWGGPCRRTLQRVNPHVVSRGRKLAEIEIEGGVRSRMPESQTASLAWRGRTWTRSQAACRRIQTEPSDQPGRSNFSAKRAERSALPPSISASVDAKPASCLVHGPPVGEPAIKKGGSGVLGVMDGS